MSGGKDYVDKELSEAVETIERTHKSLRLDVVINDPEVTSALNMTVDVMQNLPKEMLYQMSYQLGILSLNTQKTYNKSNAIKNWADRIMARIVAKTYEDYDVMIKYEIRRAKVIRDNEYAKRINEIHNEHAIICDTLEYYSSTINKLADIVERIARSRDVNQR